MKSRLLSIRAKSALAAVVAVGARGEALAGQTAGKGDQLALPGGRLEVHQRARSADHSLRQ
jgi:hypothetical protein